MLNTYITKVVGNMSRVDVQNGRKLFLNHFKILGMFVMFKLQIKEKKDWRMKYVIHLHWLLFLRDL